MTELINGRAPEEIKAGLKACTTSKVPGYGCNIPCPYLNTPNCWLPVKSDALALIEHLEAQQPKWISVKEQPPEFPCLYWDGINQIGITKSLATITLKSGKTVYLSDMFLRAFPDIKQSDVDSCTHILYWMPLPEPPKEDAHE